MRSASDQLVKRAAFDQMRNVWSNVRARAFSQMRAHLAKCATFDQMRAHLAKCAEHRNSNLLPLAIGTNEVRKPGDTQLGGTGATRRMVSCRLVSRR